MPAAYAVTMSLDPSPCNSATTRGWKPSCLLGLDTIDLTIPIADAMPAFPDEPTARFSPFSSIADGGIEMWDVALFSQLGTHVDAPSHFLPGGRTVERLDLDACMGAAVVVDVPAGVQRVGTDLVLPHETRIREAGRVIIRTGWDQHLNTDQYWTSSPELTVELARTLASWDVRFLGLDVPTPSFSDLHEVHEILLGQGMVIAECLVNLTVLHADVLLICLPLPLVGLDGAPARVVALQPSTT